MKELLINMISDLKSVVINVTFSIVITMVVCSPFIPEGDEKIETKKEKKI